MFGGDLKDALPLSVKNFVQAHTGNSTPVPVLRQRTRSSHSILRHPGTEHGAKHLPPDVPDNPSFPHALPSLVSSSLQATYAHTQPGGAVSRERFVRPGQNQGGSPTALVPPLTVPVILAGNGVRVRSKQDRNSRNLTLTPMTPMMQRLNPAWPDCSSSPGDARRFRWHT